MKNNYSNINNIIIFVIIIFSILFVIYWQTYVNIHLKKLTIIEKFGPQVTRDTGSPDTTHSINLVNSKYTCQNFCGPTARCAYTDEQCSTDLDCKGCVPPEHKSDGLKPYQLSIRGQNDAGKLSYLGNSYSELTTDIGTQAALTGSNYLKRPAQYFDGVNTWRSDFDAGMDLYKQRYEPKKEYLPNMMDYPDRWSLSGQFKNDEPLASNAFIDAPKK